MAVHPEDQTYDELLDVVHALKDRLEEARASVSGVGNLKMKGAVGEDKSKRLSTTAGGESQGESLEAVRALMGECRRCPLGETRRTVVFGEGNPRAELLFVGEGPGEEEDRQGRPFVGRAGQLLTKIIAAMGLSRDDVYIANIVKCRPPANRTPRPDEMAACTPFLQGQIRAIRPKIICALGSVAARFFLQTDAAVSVLRGRFHECDGVDLMVTFHPAYLLRNPDAKKQVWDDMKLIMKRLS